MTLRTFPVLHDLSDSLFADRFNRIDRLFSQLTGSTPLPSTPSYNIRRLEDNRYELTLSVPGWKESELEIETVGGQLNISGKREEEKTEHGEEGWIHRGSAAATSAPATVCRSMSTSPARRWKTVC